MLTSEQVDGNISVLPNYLNFFHMPKTNDLSSDIFSTICQIDVHSSSSSSAGSRDWDNTWLAWPLSCPWSWPLCQRPHQCFELTLCLVPWGLHIRQCCLLAFQVRENDTFVRSVTGGWVWKRRWGTVPSAQERILRRTNFREEHTKAEALGVSSLNTVGVHVPLGKSFVCVPQFAHDRPVNLACQACLWALGTRRQSRVPVGSGLAVWRGPAWESSRADAFRAQSVSFGPWVALEI